MTVFNQILTFSMADAETEEFHPFSSIRAHRQTCNMLE